MRRIVFLSAPLGIFEHEAYGAALSRLWMLYPPGKHRVLSSKHLWSSTADWLSSYRDVLSGVTDLYMLPDAGTVGLGVFTEWAYLRDRASCHAFTSRGCIVPVENVPTLEHPTRRRWALVLDREGKAIC